MLFDMYVYIQRKREREKEREREREKRNKYPFIGITLIRDFFYNIVRRLYISIYEYDLTKRGKV